MFGIGILNLLLKSTKESKPCEFVMEVTDRTRSDITGGILVHYEDNGFDIKQNEPQLRLLELGQVGTAVYCACMTFFCQTYLQMIERVSILFVADFRTRF